MKKLLTLLLTLFVALTLVACTTDKDPKPTPVDPKPTDPKPTDPELTVGENDLYLITDLGTIDDKSFNQGSFEGLDKFAKEAGLEKAQYIRPQGEGDQVYKAAIDQAVAAGAKVIVTPGFLFEGAVHEAQDQYPNVKFIAVDFEPAVDYVAKVGANTVSLMYREEQSGFLAGYAAVKDGYTKLGFMGGMAVPAVVNFGYGYLSGAEYAAKEMGVDVEVKYHYTGKFVESPEIQTLAASWYNSGTEVIFSCGGGIYASVLAAAKQSTDKFVIGVDSDQTVEDELFITSAMKSLQTSVYDAAKAVYDGNFQGGKTLRYGADQDGVSLSSDFSRFKTFTETDYKAIYDKLAKNTDGILDSIYSIADSKEGDNLTVKEVMSTLTFEKVTLEIFE